MGPYSGETLYLTSQTGCIIIIALSVHCATFMEHPVSIKLSYLVDCALVVLKYFLLLALAVDAEVPEDDGPGRGTRRNQLIVDR